MVSPLSGVSGFFLYRELQKQGLSDEEIELVITEQVASICCQDFEEHSEILKAELLRRLAARVSAGDKAASEFKGVDITKAARERIEAGITDHKALIEHSEKLKASEKEFLEKMEAVSKERQRVIREFNLLTYALNHSAGQPSYMQRGFVEGLAARGRDFAGMSYRG